MDDTFVSGSTVCLFGDQCIGHAGGVVAQNAISGQACDFEASFHTGLSDEAVGQK